MARGVVSGFRLHDHFQTVHQLVGFQLFKIYDGNAQLGGPVAGGGVAGLGGDNGGFGALAPKTVLQNGKLVERFRLDVAGFAADEEGVTPRAAITSISLETLPWPSTSSQRTTALLMTSLKMSASRQAL